MPFVNLKNLYKRSQRKSAKSKKNEIDDFIIKFNKNHTDDTYDAPLCCKRVIFISLIGLFRTYDQCPPYVLYSSLLILPLKRKWIYSPSQYVTELESASSHLIKTDARSNRFFEFIRWKDSQGFIFWAKDKYKSSKEDMIHPFWRFVSEQLINLYDPITSKHYEALAFDTTNWQKQIGSKSKQRRKALIPDVLREMFFMTLKFESMKRLINASNPNSFHIATAYSDNLNVNENEFMRCRSFGDDFCVKKDDGEWWISDDYYDD